MRMGSTIRRNASWLGATLSVAGIVVAAEPDRRLVTASADQDNRTIRSLIKERVDVNVARPDGSTPLLWAAHWNDLDLTDLLLRAGARVNAANDYGVTPLHQAVENANPALVGKLLNAGADPSAAEISGLTPLMIAAHTGNLQVIRLLLGHGADVNASAAETKTTALMWAVSERKKEVAKALIAAHADVHTSTSKGFTPLLYAARNGDIEMADILIGAGANVNEPGSDGTHALPLSIFKGQLDFALFLLDHGADANAGMDGIRPLHAAAGAVDPWLSDWLHRNEHVSESIVGLGGGLTGNRETRLRLVKALLAHGADPNARIDKSAVLMVFVGPPVKGAFEQFGTGTGDLRGATPLWVAAYTANAVGTGRDGNQAGREVARSEVSSDILRELLAAGADPRVMTSDGTTPLMVAAGLGRATFNPTRQRGPRSLGAEESVKILIDAGAEVNAVNEADFTALHGAAFRGLNEVVEYLVAHGANINARDFRGRTPFRIAEGAKQMFSFQTWPETAALIKRLGANTSLGLPGTVQERPREVSATDEPTATARSK